MDFLNTDILREYREHDKFPVFFQIVMGARLCHIPDREIGKIDYTGKVFFKRGRSLEALFLKLFAAKAYELKGDNKNSAICYDYAAKSADALGFRQERGEILKQCAYRYIDAPNLNFLDAGFAFLKASSCEDYRLRTFRDLKCAEHSFVCAGADMVTDVSAAFLYRDILREIKAIKLNAEFLEEKRKNLNGENLEVVIAEILFAMSSNMWRQQVEQLKVESRKIKNPAPSYRQIIMHTAVGRGYELLPPAQIINVFAAESYESASDCASALKRNYHAADISIRAAQNFIKGGRAGKAARALRFASQYCRPVFRERLARIADNLSEPKPL